MKYEQRTEVLRDGRSCLLRSLREEDAEEILSHMIQTSDETGFLSRYGEEITMTIEQERDYLKKILASPKDMMICAEVDGRIVANCGISPAASFIRHQHRANFGISVQREYWGLGIASLLLPAIIESAEKAGYEQIELEVVTENERACHVYEKFGFSIYGTRSHAFKYKDGRYCDEYLMMHILNKKDY